MAVTHADIADFSRFAGEQVSNGSREFSLSELAGKWEELREREEVRRLIHEGIADMEAGRGRTIQEVDAAIRSKLGFPTRDA